MPNPITIEYAFRFKTGQDKRFMLNLDRATLALRVERKSEPHLGAAESS